MAGFEIKGQVQQKPTCLWILVSEGSMWRGEEVMGLSYAFVFIMKGWVSFEVVCGWWKKWEGGWVGAVMRRLEKRFDFTVWDGMMSENTSDVYLIFTYWWFLILLFMTDLHCNYWSKAAKFMVWLPTCWSVFGQNHQPQVSGFDGLDPAHISVYMCVWLCFQIKRRSKVKEEYNIFTCVKWFILQSTCLKFKAVIWLGQNIWYY